MKKILIIFLFVLTNDGISQMGQDELRIFNWSTDTPIKFRIFPVSCIFNGGSPEGYLYTLVASTRPSSSNPRRWDYNNGTCYIGNDTLYEFTINPNDALGFNFDQPISGSHSTCYGSVSFGEYKLACSARQ